MKKQFSMLIAILFLCFGFVAPEERTIVGKVTSADDGSALPGVNVILKSSRAGTITDGQGNYLIKVPTTGGTLVFTFVGLKTQEINIGSQNRIDVIMQNDVSALQEVVVTGYGLQGRVAGVAVKKNQKISPRGVSTLRHHESKSAPSVAYDQAEMENQPTYNTEEYDGINENIFHEAQKNPFSTFSIDVDAASYSNVRRFIQMGQRPPKDAVRIEEMINYFDYDYPQPKGDDPFSINTEISTAPWNTNHKLVHIGLQGKNIPKENLPASNLVFLIDVSGSMDEPNKLPLLKSSFKLLVEQLREQDRVAIVVYAGAAGLVLPSTSGAEKKKIIESLENLEAGGSTAGGAGINLAYSIAK